jgi:hypothetical protein
MKVSPQGEETVNKISVMVKERALHALRERAEELEIGVSGLVREIVNEHLELPPEQPPEQPRRRWRRTRRWSAGGVVWSGEAEDEEQGR